MADSERKLSNGGNRIDFVTEPSRYRHWKLATDGETATLTMDVDENAPLFEGYQLKLNSYDLGVDIELADALERLRFEHPEVGVVLLRSGKPRVFCAGANIRMLAGSTHAHKVNFCKFTNETRCGIEDASAHSGLTFIAAVGGTAAGGGYDPARGGKVIAWAKAFLDQSIPLAEGCHGEISGWSIRDGALHPAPADPSAFLGYRGDPSAPRFSDGLALGGFDRPVDEPHDLVGVLDRDHHALVLLLRAQGEDDDLLVA